MSKHPDVARAPLSIIIPTLDAADRLPECLAALVPGAIDGLVKEVIISDGGSTDDTEAIAKAFGANVVKGARGRGPQLKQGAGAARGDWFLFLHSDTTLSPEWVDMVRSFIHGPVNDDHNHDNSKTGKIGVFRLQFDRRGFAPTLVAWGANFRTRFLKSPYGDQGLLISRHTYEHLGGYRDDPLFEDVALIDAIRSAYGGKAIHMFSAAAVTSAARYEKDGYFRRVIKNLICLGLYRAGRSPEEILKVYNA